MEPMHITVETIQRESSSGRFVAKVCATSHERVGNTPRAVIHLTIQLDVEQSLADKTRREEIARDEALRFLDPA